MKQTALAIAARSASTSYRCVLTPEKLSAMLRSGVAEDPFQAHLMTLLEEIPVQIIMRAVDEAATPDVSSQRIMENLNAWAVIWKIQAPLWESHNL